MVQNEENLERAVEAADTPTVIITWEGDRLWGFQELVQRGILVQIRAGATVKDVLCGQIGIDEQYVDGRIQTIFMDGKAVDDIGTAIVRDGCTIALSAAMPGLVGAVMRRGGFYASLRNAITYEEDGAGIRDQTGLITLKLYNMVARELGPHLLESGVLIAGSDLRSFLEQRPKGFWANCVGARIENRNVEPDSLGRDDWLDKEPLVRLVSRAAS